MKVLREAIGKAVQDPEFKTWWDAEAVKLAEVIKKIGRVETK